MQPVFLLNATNMWPSLFLVSTLCCGMKSKQTSECCSFTLGSRAQRSVLNCVKPQCKKKKKKAEK